MNAKRIVDTLLEGDLFEPDEMATDVYKYAEEARYLKAKAAFDSKDNMVQKWGAVIVALGIHKLHYSFYTVQSLSQICASMKSQSLSISKAREDAMWYLKTYNLGHKKDWRVILRIIEDYGKEIGAR